MSGRPVLKHNTALPEHSGLEPTAESGPWQVQMKTTDGRLQEHKEQNQRWCESQVWFYEGDYWQVYKSWIFTHVPLDYYWAEAWNPTKTKHQHGPLISLINSQSLCFHSILIFLPALRLKVCVHMFEQEMSRNCFCCVCVCVCVCVCLHILCVWLYSV